MPAHNYTSYKCEACNTRRPLTHVYEIGSYLRCLSCALAVLKKRRCDKCQSRQNVCDIRDGGHICIKCINTAPTVEQKLGNGELSKIEGDRLGTTEDKPEVKFSFCAVRDWLELTEEKKEEI